MKGCEMFYGLIIFFLICDQPVFGFFRENYAFYNIKI